MAHGKTRVQNALMDGIAILSEQIGAVEAYVGGVDEAVRADLANDPDLMEADRLLGVAVELTPADPVGRELELAELARGSLRRAMAMDFADGSLTTCKGLLPELKGRLEALRDNLRGLMPHAGAAVGLEDVVRQAAADAEVAGVWLEALGDAVRIAIRADQANDAHLRKAAALVEDALGCAEFGPQERIEECLAQARHALRRAMGKDFGDATKETLLALVERMGAKSVHYRDRLRCLLGQVWGGECTGMRGGALNGRGGMLPAAPVRKAGAA